MLRTIERHVPQRVNRVRRRQFLILAGALLGASFGARAMQGLRRIGFLGNSTMKLESNLVEPFRKGLREFGYVEGQNLLVEYRWAEGKYERFPQLIRDLIAEKVEVLVTAGTPATLAVKAETKTLPVVMIAVGDPVGTGVVASLAKPGGNITGLTSISAELEGKRLELLREVLPDVSHVAVLWNSASPLQFLGERRTRAAAETLGIRILSVGVRAEEGFEKAFELIAKAHPQALLVLADRLFLHHRQRIMNFATEQRLPGVHAYRELVEAGGLMSFGPSYEDMHRRAAYFVDRILKGGDPGALPVERPALFDLVINQRTVEQLGLAIPAPVLLRATAILR